VVDRGGDDPDSDRLQIVNDRLGAAHLQAMVGAIMYHVAHFFTFVWRSCVGDPSGSVCVNSLCNARGIDLPRQRLVGARSPVISHVFIMDVPTYAETLFITDAAINIFPDLDTKRDIIQNVIDLFTQVGLGTPRVAILSAVETVSSKIPSTIDAAALCKMADRGQITGGILDGPLAFDNAIDPQAAKIKGIKSEVAGRAQNPRGA
jgi:Phosphate acetyl/butaryl transferase